MRRMAGTPLAGRPGMRDGHIVIIGGGLAGLSAGCYARAAGFRTTILEHNIALGGVCTSWHRGAYTIDGCIHWLTGGSFDSIYTELGIFPAVETRVIETFTTYEDVRTGTTVPVTRDLAALARDLESLGPEDREEIARIVEGARAIASLRAPADAPELSTLRQTLAGLWELKDDVGVLVHFRKPLGAWADEHIRSGALRRFLTRIMPPEAPAVALLGVLGYLERGSLSRPIGGTARFRDALIHSYERLGGAAHLHTTVDEIVVRGDRACGVRLADGTLVEADWVISTSSSPETVFRLLGGRYGADQMRERMDRWRLFEPITLVSFGAKIGLEGVPSMWLLDGIEPVLVGGRQNDSLYVRVCNDDPSFAPPGHTVVQVLARTDYDWWASRGARYGAEKEIAAKRLLERLEARFPGLSAAVEIIDVATPLTYWTQARSWRGAYEGWLPNADGMFGHVSPTLPGLEGLYLAGQWISPGGGVPTALSSGRRAVQLLCTAEGRAFEPRPAQVTPKPLQGERPLDGTRPVLVLYATREGQTRRIAEHVAASLRSRGFSADLRDARTDPPRSVAEYGGAILAGSVHAHRHEPELVAFARAHREELEQLPTAFLSVSMAAAALDDATAPPGKHDEALAGVEKMVRTFFEQTGFRADRVKPVAGALAYTKYSGPERLVMKVIAAFNEGSTDTSKDHEYTDWEALDRFVAELCEAGGGAGPA